MIEDADTQQRIAELEKQLQQLKRALFGEPSMGRPLSLPLQALLLQVGDHEIAISVSDVEEVVPMVWVAPLPHAPEVVRGTIDYRGQLIAVIDMRYAFAEERLPLTESMLLALVTGGSRTFALVVDGVLDVERFYEEDLDGGIDVSTLPSFVTAVLRGRRQAVALLETGGLLAASELNLLQELMAEVTEKVNAE